MNTPESIIATVSAITGVPADAITGPRGSQRTSNVRTLTMALIREAKLGWQLYKIGNLFDRDHSTVVLALKRHERLLADLPEYRRWTWSLEKKLNLTTTR